MAVALTTAPTVEPLTTVEAKAHLRLEIDTDDAPVQILISAARRFVEHATGRSLITQTWTLYDDCWPECEPIRLPRGPVIAVSSVKYYDSDNVLQTMASTDYLVDVTCDPARVALLPTAVWPTAYPRINAIQVAYTAGYGATAASVPEDLKHALKLLVGHWYENREGVITGTISKALEFSIDALLDGYRILSPLAA